MPLGNPLPNTMHLKQVSRKFSKNMIFLGIMGESGIAWELVKSNDFNPTKGGLYKKVNSYEERLCGFKLRITNFL